VTKYSDEVRRHNVDLMGWLGFHRLRLNRTCYPCNNPLYILEYPCKREAHPVDSEKITSTRESLICDSNIAVQEVTWFADPEPESWDQVPQALKLFKPANTAVQKSPKCDFPSPPAAPDGRKVLTDPCLPFKVVIVPDISAWTAKLGKRRQLRAHESRRSHPSPISFSAWRRFLTLAYDSCACRVHHTWLTP